MGVASDLPSSGATQIAALNQLASLPPTGDAPAQTAKGQADVTAPGQVLQHAGVPADFLGRREGSRTIPGAFVPSGQAMPPNGLSSAALFA
jgi:hypothetical protein